MIVREGRPSGDRTLHDLTTRDVARLAAAAGRPCVSVLMATTAGPRMADADRARLGRLLRTAERRLAEGAVEGRDRLVRELRRQAGVAEASRASHALGLFVSQDVSCAWALAVTVHDKVVVEPTFATRDLLRSLHRTPPHLVVRVDELGGRVFWVAGDVTLLETVERLPVGSPRPLARGSDPDARSEDRTDLVERVDASVARLREERPAPLVLAGDPDLLAALRVGGRALQRLAGEVTGPQADTPDELFRASALCLEDYLQRRGRQTLDDLHDAAEHAPERVVAGLIACREAVASGTPGIVVVEHGYVHPGAAEVDEPQSRHDLVDDLLEVALAAGNLVAFVDDAELHEFGGIALLAQG